MKPFKLILSVFICLLMFPFVFGAVADRNVLEHWGFDTDSFLIGEKNSIELKPFGDPTNDTGKIGDQAIHCDGSGDWLVENGNHIVWDDINNDWTLNLWINTTENTRSGLFFHTENQNPQTVGGMMWEIRDTGTPQRFRWDTGGSAELTDHAETYSDGKWVMATVIFNSGLVQHFKNGSNVENKSTVTGLIDDPTINLTLCAFFDSGSPGTLPFEGSIDSLTIWNDSLTASEVEELYNAGAGLDFPFTIPPAPPNDTINLSTPLPLNGTDFKVLPISINVSGNFSFNASCKLYINGSLNDTQPLDAGQNKFLNFTLTSIDQGSYEYMINCTDNTTSEVTTNSTFHFDTSVPGFTTTFINNSFYYLENITAFFNVTDNIILDSFNLSLDNNTVHFNGSLGKNTYQFNLNINMSNLTIGKHSFFLEIKDGHTKENLTNKDAWNIKRGIFSQYLQYDISGVGYDDTYIKMYEKDKKFSDVWQAEYNFDRFVETYYPSQEKLFYTFIIESDKKIRIIEKEGMFNDRWLIIGDHWKDFVVKNEPKAEVAIKQINDYEVEVKLTGIINWEKIELESTGDLNIINATYEFYAVNLTETFTKLIFTGFEFELNLTVDFGNLEFNISDFDTAALLDYNGTNFTTSLVTFNETFAKFTGSFPGDFNSSVNGSVGHRWHFNMTNLTDGYITTNVSFQAREDIKIGKCNETPALQYPILNFTYFDEITEGTLNVTNAYNLAVFDGTFYYNQTSFFNETVQHTFCTSINPANVTYNWDAFGTLTLTKAGFITRILNIDEATPYQVSNNPMTSVNLFMIGTANSTTITYNWLTTNFELIQGTMRVYECLNNGSRNLVESIPVISGVAYANIQFLLQPYSYDITIDGVTYEDEDGFTLCHTESVTDITYFVDISTIDLSALIGLSSIQCSLNKITNSSVQMVWGENPEQTGYVSGCILAYRRMIGGLVEVFNNCSVEADGYNRTVGVPINGNEYIVRAEMVQESNIVTCGGEVSFFVGRPAAELFSFTGLFAALLLIMGCGLIYSGKPTQQMIGTGIGVVSAFALSLVNVSWITIAYILLILIIVAIVGRLSQVDA